QDMHYRLVVPEGGRLVVYRALQEMWKERDWLMILDELRDLSDPRPPHLRLGPQLTQIYRRGATRGLYIVGVTQAPRWVPREFYEAPEFLYIGQMLDKDAR